MYRSCVSAAAVMLLLCAAGATAQSTTAGRPAFPGLFGFSVNDPVDRARLAAGGFEERSVGPVVLWVSQRPNSFFNNVVVTPMPGNMIGMIAASAPIARPAGAADSPAMREALMARCQAARAAIIQLMFDGFPRGIENETSTYIAERMEPGAQIAASSVPRAIINCTLNRREGQVELTLQLGRSDF